MISSTLARSNNSKPWCMIHTIGRTISYCSSLLTETINPFKISIYQQHSIVRSQASPSHGFLGTSRSISDINIPANIDERIVNENQNSFDSFTMSDSPTISSNSRQSSSNQFKPINTEGTANQSSLPSVDHQSNKDDIWSPNSSSPKMYESSKENSPEFLH